jgi:hypothetical protein
MALAPAVEEPPDISTHCAELADTMAEYPVRTSCAWAADETAHAIVASSSVTNRERSFSRAATDAGRYADQEIQNMLKGSTRNNFVRWINKSRRIVTIYLVGKKPRQGCSFLKKRTKRLLFLRRSQVPGHGLDLSAGAGHKSLLLLFFRK